MSNRFMSQDDNPLSFRVNLDKHNDSFRLDQDVEQYKNYAKEVRENMANMSPITRAGINYRPYMLIPDIVAIDILLKYGIDVHSAEFMHDEAQKKRVEGIMKADYSDLVF